MKLRQAKKRLSAEDVNRACDALDELIDELERRGMEAER